MPSDRFRPKRRFGQNFLVNQGAIDQIIAAFRPSPGDCVLEIGPGRGALTRRLLGRVTRVTAIEIDRTLAADLRASLLPLSPPGTLRVVEGDILSIDLPTLLREAGGGGHSVRVIANLPYNIATAIILKLLSQRPVVRDLLVMVQREVAARILASAGSRAYGGLSVLCQAFSRVESVLRLRPGSFRPSPRVESEVIRLVPFESAESHRPGDTSPADPATLGRLLRICFEHRRKTLLNNLAGLVPGGRAGETLRRAGLDPRARPEAVPVEGYLSLLSVLRVEGAL